MSFNEEDHPRDNDGKFSDKGGGGSSSDKPFTPKKEAKPIPSQPKNITKKLSDVTKTSMKNVNNER